MALQDDSETRVKLTDLPCEALEKIMCYVGFKEVDSARCLAWPVKKACTSILRSAYRKLEMGLVRDISVMRRRFVDLWTTMQTNTTNGLPTSYETQIGMHKTSDCILQLETVYSSFVLVKSAVWSYVTAGLSPGYDGKLLDTVYAIRNEIMSSADSEPVPKQAVVHCRRAAAKHIARFADWLARARFSGEERRAADVAAGISLLETLLCSFDSYNTVPHVMRCADNGDSGLVTLSVVYSLNNCWMGIESTAAYRAKAPEDRFGDVVQVIRELVWNSNNEIHLYDWQERKKLVSDFEFDSYVIESPIHLRSGVQTSTSTYVDIIRDASCFGRTFNAVDVADDRVVYYGNSSRVRGPPTIGESFQEQQQAVLDGQVVNVPRAFRDGVVDVQLELTCREDQLPRYLVAMCTTGEAPRTFVEAASPFRVEVSSHESEERDGEFTRAYGFWRGGSWGSNGRG